MTYASRKGISFVYVYSFDQKTTETKFDQIMNLPDELILWLLIRM